MWEYQVIQKPCALNDLILFSAMPGKPGTPTANRVMEYRLQAEREALKQTLLHKNSVGTECERRAECRHLNIHRTKSEKS